MKKLIVIRDYLYLNGDDNFHVLNISTIICLLITTVHNQYLFAILLGIGVIAGNIIYLLKFDKNKWFPFIFDICLILFTLFCLLNYFSSETYYLKYTDEVSFYQNDKLGDSLGINIEKMIGNGNTECIENEDGSITYKKNPVIKYEKIKYEDGTIKYIPITEY